MLRLMFFTDPHISHRNPLGRIDNYKEAVLNKIRWLTEECKKRQVDHVLCGGDWFHIKRPERVPRSLDIETAEVAREFPLPIHTVLGNHSQSPDGGYGKHPLAVLELAGVVKILDKPMALGGVLILSRNYNAQRTADPEYYSPTEDELVLMKGKDTVIMMAHGDVLAPGDERPYPYVNVDQIPNVQAYNIFFCGHIHENLGITEFVVDNATTQQLPEFPAIRIAHTTLFINPGSLGRTARTQANYARKVQAVIIEIGGRDTPLHAEMIEVPTAPAVEVFEAKGVDEKEPVSDGIQQFVTTLGQGLRVEKLSIDELLAGIEGLEPGVRRLVKVFLEESE